MNARDLFLSPELAEEEVCHFLSGYGIEDPLRADSYLQQMAGAVGLPERLADLAPILLDAVSASVDPDAALKHFWTFLEHAPSALNLLSFLQEDPCHVETLVSILGASPYLMQALIRSPDYFYWLTEQDRLRRIPAEDYFSGEVEEVLRPFESCDSILNALRRFQRRELIRIAAQDLLGITSLEQTMTQVSDLADTVLHKAWQALAKERLPSPKGFAVLALGKLGGRELNFSSDIDLLFLYGDEHESRRMVKFAREYRKALTAFTPDGHLYRVDLRLRPMGRAGEIVYSEKAAHQYYTTWADTSDRLAMIKCRAVAGDLDLGRRFVDSIQEFVFKKYLDYAAVEEIRWIKRRTDQALSQRHSATQNVKLGLGGIREIEFFAQAFQILYGGIHTELRTPTTLEALRRLLDGGFIQRNEYDSLTEAYVYLRNLEHKLQLVHDLQTHALPDSERELFFTARRMGYKSPPDNREQSEIVQRFRADLQRHNLMVRRIFASLFEDRRRSRGIEELVLNPGLEEEEALGRLHERGIQKPRSALEGIKILQQAPAYPQSPTRMRNLSANLLPQLLDASSDLAEPRELFSRFDRFCDALGSRSSLYVEMIENHDFSHRLLYVLGSGEFLSETLIQNSELLDLLSSIGADGEIESEALDASLSRSAGRGLSHRDGLRLYKRREEFKIGIAELFHPGHPETRSRLTRLAERCVKSAVSQALQVDATLTEEPFAFLALGKLGGSELIFHSDLDLLFVVDDEQTARPLNDFLPFLKAFREELQAYTEKGQAYKVDLRLRPEGRYSGEAVGLTQLRTYFRERAAAWERLAYVKTRPILELGCRVPLKELIFRGPFSPSEREKLRHIRHRKEKEIGREDRSESYNFKVGRGGLLDLQFLIQELQIKYDVIEPNSLSAIEKLCTEGAIDTVTGGTLEENLRFLFLLESMTDLTGAGQAGKLSRDPADLEHLAHLMGIREGGEMLLERYRHCTERNREIYQRVSTQD